MMLDASGPCKYVAHCVYVPSMRSEIEQLKSAKRELVESILEDLKMSFVYDRDTVLKNFPSTAKGYSRCLMLIDELITKYKEA
jgi:hypothetical protein